MGRRSRRGVGARLATGSRGGANALRTSHQGGWDRRHRGGVAAAVGWAGPVDPAKNGVIMEYHDKATREEAERMIVQMLEEAFRVRGETIRDMQVFAVEHRVERTGCALAAVTLLSQDDLVDG